MFDPKKPTPLAVGVHREIRSQLPEASNKAVDRFLRWWTGRYEYLKSITESGFRYSIEQQLSGPVEEKHAKQAAVTMGKLEQEYTPKSLRKGKRR